MSLIKLKSFRRFALVLICLNFLNATKAQDEIHTDFITRANFVFANIEKNRVPHGLLLDYAMEFADLGNYNGTLTDTNKVNTGILRDLYATVAMSAIHSNAGGFYGIDYRDSIWDEQRQPGIVTLSGLFYNYSRFTDDAITNNKLTANADQLYDKYNGGVWQNPYQTETVFAMSPAMHAYGGTSMQVVLPANLWHTNNAVNVSSIAIDFNNGSGYQTITAGTPVAVNYADTGTKNWKFRLTLNNGTILYSHTLMQIMPDAMGNTGGNARFLRPGPPILLTADEAFNGAFGQGWITVDYANPPSAGTGGTRLRLNRPLIVAEGFDAGSLLNPENQFGSTTFAGFIRAVNGSAELTNLLQSDNQQYDIIYVDWRNGTDFLQRNALLLERVIRWVNEEKVADGSTQPNVVLGQSMGGVIARWALRDMENKGLPHQTRLYVSYDAPHQGANVPLAYQHAARHANDLLMGTTIPTFLGGNPTFRLVRNALNLMDVPAAQQMLYNRVLNNGNLSNIPHVNWQSALQTMGYPQLTRNIAISNGSECGLGQGFNPGATLFSINGKANTRFLTDIIGSFTGLGIGAWGGLSLITLKPQFLLGILPGRNDFLFDFYCKAQPTNSTAQIYRGNISYKKRILWLIPINTTITNRSRFANSSVLALDGTAGGLIDTEINLEDDEDLNWAIRYNIAMSNIPHFNFIPTPSALDIGSGNTTLTIANYQQRYVGGLPPNSPLNSPFANFTTAFSQTPLSNDQISNNESHIAIGPRNGNWLAAELAVTNPVPTFTNCAAFCVNGEIAGAQSFCTTETYTAPFGNGVTYNWSVNDPGLVTTNANGNTFQITRNGNSSANITITVLMTGDCGITTLTRNVSFGYPLISYNINPYSTGDECYQTNAIYNFSIEPGPNDHQLVTGYEWGYRLHNSSNETIVGDPNFPNTTISIVFPTTGLYEVFVRPRNDCGSGLESSIFVDVISNCRGVGGWFRITTAPNPTRDDMYVTLDEEKPEVRNLSNNENVQFDLYEFYNRRLVKQWKLKNDQKQYKLNVRGLKKGMYVLVVSKGKYQQSKQVIIE